MTEEIIVDGVNIAGCEFYELCGCVDDNHELNECKDNPNCYYKQLKRLEQENKEIYENGQIEITKLCNEKTKYRSALEEIRKIEELAYYSKGMPEEPLSQCDFMLDAINNYEQRRIKILTKINEVLNG